MDSKQLVVAKVMRPAGRQSVCRILTVRCFATRRDPHLVPSDRRVNVVFSTIIIELRSTEYNEYFYGRKLGEEREWGREA